MVKRAENRRLKEDNTKLYYLEQIIGNLRLVIRRVYKENLAEVYKSTMKHEEDDTRDKETLKKYHDSMAILDMGEEELSQFVGLGLGAKSNESKGTLAYFIRQLHRLYGRRAQEIRSRVIQGRRY